MKKRRRKIKKKPVLVLVCCIILIIVISIFTIKTINEVNYRKTIEYKLLNIGYSKDEITTLEKKTNDTFMNSLLDKEYDKMYLEIVNEKYFINDKINDYIEYYEKHLNSSSYDIIALINIGADKEKYTNIKNTDTSKDILMINNKYYQLSKDYVPDDLVNVKNWYSYGNNAKLREVAYNAFIEMYNAAKAQNLTIIINSSYRSYQEQEEIYNQYLSQHGQEYTDAYAARPGHSEHQTGLTMDVTTYGANGNNFEQTDVFKWLQDNAHLYGFILRYPKDKEYLTGYDYESWHYRYVGVEAATIIHDNNITFDEYYAYYIENVSS